jgi:hypothetical protein
MDVTPLLLRAAIKGLVSSHALSYKENIQQICINNLYNKTSLSNKKKTSDQLYEQL